MKSVILDTNIIVSALISDGIPSKILQKIVLNRKSSFYISKEVYEEYTDVLNRKKFLSIPSFSINAQIVLNRLNEIATTYVPKIRVDLLKDKSDNKFLELALASKADYLITGNTHDFTINKIGETVILSPMTFWNEFDK